MKGGARYESDMRDIEGEIFLVILFGPHNWNAGSDPSDKEIIATTLTVAKSPEEAVEYVSESAPEMTVEYGCMSLNIDIDTVLRYRMKTEARRV